jgi:CRISPR-associated endonuclease Csn1
LSPNPANLKTIGEEQAMRVYKMVSCTGSQCMFVRNDVANPIVNKEEFSPLNKMEKSIEGVMIKDSCWKIKVDRLGNIIAVNDKLLV